MIKIRRGTQILTVPTKAYKEFYSQAGWLEIVPEKPKVSKWEAEVAGLTNKELKQLAQERGLEVAGVSKKALTEALIKMGE